jgi:hypothetical protein
MAHERLRFLHGRAGFHEDRVVGNAAGVNIKLTFTRHEDGDPGGDQVFPKFAGRMRRNVEQRILRYALGAWSQAAAGASREESNAK